MKFVSRICPGNLSLKFDPRILPWKFILEIRPLGICPGNLFLKFDLEI